MDRFFGLARIGVLSALLAFLALASAQTASASPDAEAFTQRLVDTGVGILRNTSDPGRRAKFREFITQYAQGNGFKATPEYVSHTADVLAAWELRRAALGGDVWTVPGDR